MEIKSKKEKGKYRVTFWDLKENKSRSYTVYKTKLSFTQFIDKALGVLKKL